MSDPMILVQGLYLSEELRASAGLSSALVKRSTMIKQSSERLGVQNYELLEGGSRAMANRFLQLARGTARAVDAAEVFELDETALRRTLGQESGRECWQQVAGCAPYGFDRSRSFILIGRLRLLVDGPVTGQRVLWFGRGLDTLSDSEFIEHYTGHHGPLVAGNSKCLGISRYRQVANEQGALCDALRELGLGQANPPSVFAELAMGMPPLTLSSLRARRVATREIKADEKRHIDFRRSMLLLV